MHEHEMNALALPELLYQWIFQRWTYKSVCQIPKNCGVCGTASKGNWFTGYYLPCLEKEGFFHKELRTNVDK